MPATPASVAGDRLAKVIARAGVCSRRDAEGWIRDGRIAVNGKVVRTPAFNVGNGDTITVDGEPLAARAGTRLWLYHKPPGLVVTEKDTEGRNTVFEKLAAMGLPRVLSVGRLDIATEGLLLLTNDGGLKRVLELPSTGWMRRYRVRAFGSVTQAQLDVLKDGIEVEGVQYGPIEATLERPTGSNVWLSLGLREGKNREVKNVLAALGLQVNRLIRVSYGPFQLGDLPQGEVETVPARVLREQLGHRLAKEAGTDFDSDMPEVAAQKQRVNPKVRAAGPGQEPRQGKASVKSRPADRPKPDRDSRSKPERSGPRVDERKHSWSDRPSGGPGRRPREEVRAGPPRTIHFDDGRTEQFRPAPERDARPRRDDRPQRDDRPRRDRDEARPATGKPRTYGAGPAATDKPRGSRPFKASTGKPGAPSRPSRPKGKSFRPDRGAAAGPRPAGSRPEGARPPRAGRPLGGAAPRGQSRPAGPGGKPRPPRKPRP